MYPESKDGIFHKHRVFNCISMYGTMLYSKTINSEVICDKIKVTFHVICN